MDQVSVELPPKSDSLPVMREQIQLFRRADHLHSHQILFAGNVFFGVSIFLFLSLMWLILVRGISINETILQRAGNSSNSASELFVLYLSIYSSPFFIILSAFVCMGMGYILLGQAGAIVRTAIPPEDRELLRSLNSQDEKGVEQYIRLTSLTGLTGFFTKIGITGLPLATIALTLIFGSLALFSSGNGSSKFLDFANLTLGAFLGSYVQKQVSHKGEK